MMPYITRPQRVELSRGYDDRVRLADDPGELNYNLTFLVHEYLIRKGNTYYVDYNEVIGVLEAVKLEFYRRAVAPYEDKKIKENGDLEEYDHE